MHSVTYTNYSTLNPLGTRGKIPASQFKASPKTSRGDLILMVTGVAIVAIAALCLVTSSYGTTAFWVGTAGLAFGVASLILGLALNYYSKNHGNKYFQTLKLDTVKTIEDYQLVLSTDKRINYSYEIPNFVKGHIEANERLGGNLEKSSTLDNGRMNIFLLDGKPVALSEVANVYGEYNKYANQSAVSDISATLMSRYTNNDLSIFVQQRSFPDTPNTQFNLVTKGGRCYLEVSQLLQISHLGSELTCLKYIKGNMRIDLDTGDAVISWSSPTNELPSL